MIQETEASFLSSSHPPQVLHNKFRRLSWTDGAGMHFLAIAVYQPEQQGSGIRNGAQQDSILCGSQMPRLEPPWNKQLPGCFIHSDIAVPFAITHSKHYSAIRNKTWHYGAVQNKTFKVFSCILPALCPVLVAAPQYAKDTAGKGAEKKIST